MSLPKYTTFIGNFCKGVKIFHFSSELIFGQLLQTFGNFLLVTLDVIAKRSTYFCHSNLKVLIKKLVDLRLYLKADSTSDFM